MSRAVLLPLLRHYDAAVAAQAVELVSSLSPAERLDVSQALLAHTWRPGDPWLALRLCSATPAEADARLRRWHACYARRALALVPDDPVWHRLAAQLDAHAAAPAAAELRVAAGAAEALWHQTLTPRTQAHRCGRVLLVAAEESSAGDRRGGYSGPHQLRRCQPPEHLRWARLALTALCADALATRPGAGSRPSEARSPALAPAPAPAVARGRTGTG